MSRHDIRAMGSEPLSCLQASKYTVRLQAYPIRPTVVVHHGAL